MDRRKILPKRGSIVILPCKYGDILYVIPTKENGLEEITRYECLGFEIGKPSNTATLFRKENGKSRQMFQPSFEKFGKTVFFSLEEAERVYMNDEKNF